MQSNNVTVPTVPTPRPFFQNKFTPGGFQKSPGFFQNNQQFRQQANAAQAIEFDGKRLRKAVARKTVDYNASIVKYLETRTWQRDYRDRRALQPDVGYSSELMPPMSYLDNPVNAITTKFVRTSTNKMRCPIFCVVWTPEGRRLITGASSGEFTLWNGLTFNFETILQAHDSPVRCMVWSHNDIWMVTGDHSGYVKYWQSNMNNVKMFQAHKEPLRGLSFCPTDTKFVTCSDDGTVRIWDFLRCHEEKILRGHGADVKCVSWHPQKSLIVSGSKDSQQPIKLWDPKSGQSLATLHAHKSTVMEVKWNQNGTWMLTASRDHLLKLFDIRNMSQEVQTFRGHKKEACSISWHPIHESMFVSGGSDGSVMFWVVGADKEVGSMEQAHESCVWSLGWHPLGHILCTGSNDHTSKFWTRNRPGDRMRDKYNLNTLPRGQDETAEYDEPSIGIIPGMGLDVFGDGEDDGDFTPAIPGLDFGSEDTVVKNGNASVHVGATSIQHSRKVPFSKPIPRQFQQQWMENKQPLLLAPPPNAGNNDMNNQSQQPILQAPPMGSLLPPVPLLPQGAPPQMAPPSLQGTPMVPNMTPGAMMQNNTQHASNMMQGNPDNNQVLMGDMSNRTNLLSGRSDFTGANNQGVGSSTSPNFMPLGQPSMLQAPNMQQMQGGNQFGPQSNIFMNPRMPLDQSAAQVKVETPFMPRGNQMLLQRQALLGNRPNEGDNANQIDTRANVNVGVSSAPITTINDNRNMNNPALNQTLSDDRGGGGGDWQNKYATNFDSDNNNRGRPQDSSGGATKDSPTVPSSTMGSGNNNSAPPPPPNNQRNIPPQFNFMQQAPSFQQQNIMSDQRFGNSNRVDDFDQSNFNRNVMNMPRGGMTQQNFQQQQAPQPIFQQPPQFGGGGGGGNFGDDRFGGNRMMGGGGGGGLMDNNDFNDMSDNNMRKRQWDEGPGDMGGGGGGGGPPMGGAGPFFNQSQGGFPNRGGGNMGGNLGNMGNRVGGAPSGPRGFMNSMNRGGGGGRGGGMMGPQRGGPPNRPFRGHFRGNRGNMRGNPNF